MSEGSNDSRKKTDHGKSFVNNALAQGGTPYTTVVSYNPNTNRFDFTFLISTTLRAFTMQTTLQIRLVSTRQIRRLD